MLYFYLQRSFPDFTICCYSLLFPNEPIIFSFYLYNSAMSFRTLTFAPFNPSTLSLFRVSSARTVYSETLSVYIKLLLYHISSFPAFSVDYSSHSDCLIHGKYSTCCWWHHHYENSTLSLFVLRKLKMAIHLPFLELTIKIYHKINVYKILRRNISLLLAFNHLTAAVPKCVHGGFRSVNW